MTSSGYIILLGELPDQYSLPSKILVRLWDARKYRGRRDYFQRPTFEPFYLRIQVRYEITCEVIARIQRRERYKRELHTNHLVITMTSTYCTHPLAVALVRQRLNHP